MSATLRNASPLDDWIAEGEQLGTRERDARSLMWDIGDWWNRGEPLGSRVAIVTADNWTGPGHGTVRVAGSVAKRWGPLSRLNTLSFKHHQIVSSLPDAEAIPLLEIAAKRNLSAAELRSLVKQARRAAREVDLAETIRLSSAALGSKLYGVIYADPPWRFEPYSRTSGMDRAADNHYPTLTYEEILALTIEGRKVSEIAADDAVLFLWATAPMLLEALDTMEAWGFEYRTHLVWIKDKAGTGYWARNQHELLLIGARGAVPAPAPGEQYASVIEAEVQQHSKKPAHFAELIESMFPSAALLEVFAREPRAGWDVWGNEVGETEESVP
jgi:N6-adenosine-specific RNA methylase IME4